MSNLFVVVLCIFSKCVECVVHNFLLKAPGTCCSWSSCFFFGVHCAQEKMHPYVLGLLLPCRVRNTLKWNVLFMRPICCNVPVSLHRPHSTLTRNHTLKHSTAHSALLHVRTHTHTQSLLWKYDFSPWPTVCVKNVYRRRTERRMRIICSQRDTHRRNKWTTCQLWNKLI